MRVLEQGRREPDADRDRGDDDPRASPCNPERRGKRDPERRADVRIEPGMLVRADPTLMHLVLENLLSNAWKFTGKKDSTRIEFGQGADANGYHFFIRDNGAGFDPRYATRMFEPFSRMHPRDEFEGTGVGLATVRRILARHGGEIRAESKVGEGATFYFSLGSRDARLYRQQAGAQAAAPLNAGHG